MTPHRPRRSRSRGWRVLVPRGGKWGDGVAATLRSYGAIPVIAPLINFASTPDQPRSRTRCSGCSAGSSTGS